jgi:hypothetical protein
LNCLYRELSFVLMLMACNVEAWRSAGDSIPSAWLAAVDFLFTVQVTINCSIE